MAEDQPNYHPLMADGQSSDASVEQFNTEMELLSFQAERLFLALFSKLKRQVDEQQKINLTSALKIAKEVTRDLSVLSQIKSKSCHLCISTLHLAVEKESDFQRIFAHYLSQACHHRNKQSQVNSVWVLHFIEKIKISLGSDRFELAEMRSQAIIEDMKQSEQFSYSAFFVNPKAIAEYVLILLELAGFLSANDKRLEWLINGMLSNPNAQTKSGLIMIQATHNEPPPTYSQITCMLDTLFKDIASLVAEHQLTPLLEAQLATHTTKVTQVLTLLSAKIAQTQPCIER